MLDIIAAFVLTALIAYLLGSISFSIIFTHLFIKKDIRDFGSGNAGATNVLRSVGAFPALLTLIGDFGKGIAAVLIGAALFQHFNTGELLGDYAASIGKGLAGLFALLGHLFPLYFKFKGGKGVLTAAGICCVMSPECFVVCVAAFLITIAISRIVSLSSCVAVGIYPIPMFIWTYFFQYRVSDNVPIGYVLIMTLLAAIYSGIVVFMHRSNIKRLIAGTEPKITVKKNK